MPRRRTIFNALLVCLAAAPLLSSCSGGLGTAASGLARASCPANVLSVQSIQAANFGLESEIEAHAKAALSAGAVVTQIAAEIETEVLAACINIATDLGVSPEDLEPSESGPGAKVEAACGAAAKAIGEVRATIEGDFELEVEPARCTADMNAMADCAGRCDVDVDPGSAEVKCEGGELSGKCTGKCQGTCTVEAGAECSGSCAGSCKGTCSGEVTGKCKGTCQGKCDGKDSSGKCTGICEGTCEGKANATCEGTCEGTCDARCEMRAEGECGGTCTGECSADFESPRCTGEVKPPEMSAECEAQCEAEVTAKLECRPAQVRLASSIEVDTAQIESLIATLETNLPALVKVAGSLKTRAEDVVASARASVKGMKATVEGAGSDAIAVAGCFATSLEAQAKASAKISVSVEASASVSSKASGSI